MEATPKATYAEILRNGLQGPDQPAIQKNEIDWRQQIDELLGHHPQDGPGDGPGDWANESTATQIRSEGDILRSAFSTKNKSPEST